MKPFDAQSKANGQRRPARDTPVTPADGCAALLMETVPRVMRALRLAMATLEPPTLTVPQFRTLHFVHTHAGPSLSATAEFLGLTLPSSSKLVDQLVRRGLLARDDDAADRRRMTLRLTNKGDALLQGAMASLRRHLAGTLSRFGAEELTALHRALGLLQESFPAPAGPAETLDHGNGHVEPAKSTTGRLAAVR